MAKPWKIVDLDPTESLKVCLRKITETRLQETLSYENRTIKGEDIESLHDMRVSARRLRAVLKIFRDCFPKKRLKKLDERLQGVIRSLGAVRERDVFIEMLVAYRQTLDIQDGKVIDLLLAREQSLRLPLRQHLSRDLKQLHKANFSESFRQFLKETR
jgi:CHAD domain-containing protein